MKFNLLFLSVLLSFTLFSCGSSEESQGNDASNNESTDTLDTLQESIESPEESSEEYSFSGIVELSQNLKPKVASLDSIYNYFNIAKESMSQEEIDSCYFVYVGMMERIVGAFSDVEDAGSSYEDALALYGPYGFNIAQAEGYLWLKADQSKAGKRFKKDISDDLFEYSRLGEITGQQHSGDAAMIHGYMDWGKIVTDLEDRLRKNKKSKYYRYFMSTYKEFLYWYMYGMENTPITSWGDEPGLNEETAAAYEAMMADKTHKTGKIIKDHISKLKATNFNISWDDRWDLTEKEVEKYLEL